MDERDTCSGGLPLGLASPRARCHGFTLLEVMVSLLIIAGVLVLVFPSLSGVRKRAWDAQTLSNLRQSAALLDVYTNDSRGAHVFFGDPSGVPVYVPFVNREGGFTLDHYFDMHFAWHSFVADRLGMGDGEREVFGDAESRAINGIAGHQFYHSCSYFADPGYWNDRTREGKSQWRGTYQHEVALPAAKVTLLSSYPMDFHADIPRLSRSAPAAFADGSASIRKVGDFIPGMFYGDGLLSSIHVHDRYFGMHTIDGVRGRDVR
ncbi:MAG: type II secretion system protein [Phycisphaerales bacterium]